MKMFVMVIVLLLYSVAVPIAAHAGMSYTTRMCLWENIHVPLAEYERWLGYTERDVVALRQLECDLQLNTYLFWYW